MTNESDYEYCATFDASVDFTSQVTVNDKMRLILTISNLSVYINRCVKTVVGAFNSIYYFNAEVGVALKVAQVAINTFLSNGLDLNWVINDIIGIKFIYFKAFELTERE